jgi:hypothetical protein
LIDETISDPDRGNVTAMLPVSIETSRRDSFTEIPSLPGCDRPRFAVTVYPSAALSSGGIAWPVHLIDPSRQ